MRSFKVEIIIALFLLTALKAIGQDKQLENSPQYLYDSFSIGEVLMKDGKVQPAVMNYNTVTDKLIFEQNGQLLELSNLFTVDTIYLKDTKFIVIDNAFYEVIDTSSIPILIQHKGKLQQPKKEVGFGGTSDVASSHNISIVQMDGNYYNLPLPTNFKVTIDPIYSLMKDGKIVKFSSVRNLQKLFPEKKNEIQKFVKDGKLKFNNREDIEKIISFIARDTE